MVRKLNTQDVGITGVHDDGSVEGIVRTKIEQSDLVKVPLSCLDVIASVGGSGTCQMTQATSSNSDGSGMTVNLVTTAGFDNIATCYFLLRGRKIGIRYRKNSATPPFSVIVDGIPFSTTKQDLRYFVTNIEYSQSLPEREAVFWIDGLQDITHTIRVVLHPSATVQNILVIFGAVAEKRVGYVEIPRLDYFWGQGTITSSYNNIANTDIALQPQKGINEIWYHNPDSNSQNLYVQYNSVQILKRTLLAGETYVLPLSDFGIMTGASSTGLRHKSDSSLITFTFKSKM